mmetsp:Transcript_24499/g.45681  ORF Transcript_24499/g.45681 Transcript_24499/m.45681 type:complete len:203 (+) Transcript_24499:225-833(+)
MLLMMPQKTQSSRSRTNRPWAAQCSCSSEEACQSKSLNDKEVRFHNRVKVYKTISLSEFTEEEKASTWFSDDDWARVRRDVQDSKTKLCPTVERFQPYHVSDRKATIRYVQQVVFREQAKFRKLCLQAERNNDKSLPCVDCHGVRIGFLYRAATRKSRDEARALGCLCQVEVRGNAFPEQSKPTYQDQELMKKKILSVIAAF